MLTKLSFCIILIIISTIGLLLVRQNAILLLISIELLMLAIISGFLFTSIYFDDLLLQFYVLFLFTLIVSESITGLSILVSIYKPSPIILFKLNKKFKWLKINGIKITKEKGQKSGFKQIDSLERKN